MADFRTASEYGEMAVEVGVIIGQVETMVERCEELKEREGDNGDPYFDLKEASRMLGRALASMVVYASEYSKENENEKTGLQGDDRRD